MLDTLLFYYYVPRISEQTNLCLYYIIAASIVHQNSITHFQYEISNINIFKKSLDPGYILYSYSWQCHSLLSVFQMSNKMSNETNQMFNDS